MKTIFTILLINLCVTVYGFNWILYGPQEIHSNNILFGAGNHAYSIICTNDGVCVNNGTGYSWNTYSSSLPVWEALPYDTANILLVMGNGSYSDGIYKFNLQTNTFSIVKWIYIPTFIKFNTVNHTYYAGSRYDGLFHSADGITWDTVSYFQGKGCAAMDFYGQHLVVTQANNIFATYYSGDGGATWNQSTSNIPVHDIAYDYIGNLFGIFPGQSNSSGLYLSHNFGQTWNMEYWTDNMNIVGFDVVGNLFIGFHGALPTYEGIAIYDTTSNNFMFLNTGLPNKNINRFKVNPIMSSITIFACTDSGVYFCNNYLTSIQNNDFTVNKVSIYPNPATENIFIELSQYADIEIVNIHGQIIESLKTVSSKTRLDISDLSKGLYYIKVKTGKEITVKKFMKL